MFAAYPADPVVDAELNRLTDPLHAALPSRRREHVSNLQVVHWYPSDFQKGIADSTYFKLGSTCQNA
jgi:hypothetical protein